jgi:pimeloyl-ACP methyl ester carboxylesterase
VHGSLDRGASFGRVRRRLADLPTVTYDRRGYQGSRGAVPLAEGLADHVDDLLAVIGGRTAVVFGHSYGGNVALGAALDPRGSSIRALAAYEPPQPWLRPNPGVGADGRTPAAPWADDDPGAAAERFFRRMVGDAAWDRLTDAEREARRADGPALAAELAAIRVRRAPFDVGELRIPVVYGRGEDSLPHHRQAVAWLAEHTPGAELFEIPGARHGAHLTHPDGVATMVRRAVARGASSANGRL